MMGLALLKAQEHVVVKQILDDKPRAVYTHFYGHSLNLTIGDTVKGCNIMKNCLDLIFELSKLVKFSPKRCKF